MTEASVTSDGQASTSRITREVLDGAAAVLLEAHLARSKEWFPHQLVPWELGRRFTDDDDGRVPEVTLEDGVASALWVNLLTEDNLPLLFSGDHGDLRR